MDILNIATSGCPSTSASVMTTVSPSPSPPAITTQSPGSAGPTSSTNTTDSLTVGLIITSITSVICLSLLMVIVVILILKRKAAFLTPTAKHGGAIDNITYQGIV